MRLHFGFASTLALSSTGSKQDHGRVASRLYQVICEPYHGDSGAISRPFGDDLGPDARDLAIIRDLVDHFQAREPTLFRHLSNISVRVDEAANEAEHAQKQAERVSRFITKALQLLPQLCERFARGELTVRLRERIPLLLASSIIATGLAITLLAALRVGAVLLILRMELVGCEQLLAQRVVAGYSFFGGTCVIIEASLFAMTKGLFLCLAPGNDTGKKPPKKSGFMGKAPRRRKKPPKKSPEEDHGPGPAQGTNTGLNLPRSDKSKLAFPGPEHAVAPGGGS
jgi:hypothetical protein